MSPYREKQKREFLAQGFAGFELVYNLNPFRGMGVCPDSLPDNEKPKYKIIVRPAKSGKWSKCVVIRAIRVS